MGCSLTLCPAGLPAAIVSGRAFHDAFEALLKALSEPAQGLRDEEIVACWHAGRDTVYASAIYPSGARNEP